MKIIYLIIILAIGFTAGWLLRKPKVVTETVGVSGARIEVVERCTKVEEADTITKPKAKPHCLLSPKAGTELLTITSPKSYSTITSPFQVRGTANTFEGTFQLQIKD